MKYPTEEELTEEVQSLKDEMKGLDFQMGIGGHTEKKLFNKINKILRMLKYPVRRVYFAKDIGEVKK